MDDYGSNVCLVLDCWDVFAVPKEHVIDKKRFR